MPSDIHSMKPEVTPLAHPLQSIIKMATSTFILISLLGNMTQMLMCIKNDLGCSLTPHTKVPFPLQHTLIKVLSIFNK